MKKDYKAQAVCEVFLEINSLIFASPILHGDLFEIRLDILMSH